MKLIVLGLVVVALAPSIASAQAAERCQQLRLANGTAAVEVRATGTTCTIARSVVRAWGRNGDGRARDSRGRTWRCRTTQTATGTDPGYVERTKVRCTRGRSVIRFAVAS